MIGSDASLGSSVFINWNQMCSIIVVFSLEKRTAGRLGIRDASFTSQRVRRRVVDNVRNADPASFRPGLTRTLNSRVPTKPDPKPHPGI